MNGLALVLGPSASIRRAAVTWLLSIGALVVITVAFWPAFKGSAGLSAAVGELPQGFVQALGMEDFGTPAGYLRGNLYELLVPLLLAGAAIGFASSLTAGEEESGRLELHLAQPVTRQASYFGRVAASLAWVAVVTAGTLAIQLGTNAVVGLSVATDRLVATLILSGLLGALHGALAFAIAGFRPRPSVVIGVGLFVAIAGCTVASLFPISPALSPWAAISPWDWALGGDPLIRDTALWRYVALAVPSLALVLAGAFGFTHRDVRAA